MRTVVGIAFLGALFVTGHGLLPDQARAQPRSWNINTPHEGGRPFQLDVHGGFTWWGLGAATGVRFGIPLVNNGFIDSLNNAVYLNFGADFYWIRERSNARGWDYGPGFGFPVTLHWEFYLNETWSLFGEIGAQFFLHPAWLNGGRFDWREPGAWFVWTVGGTWHINDSIGLTLRAGSPYVAAGLTFQFGG
ncbi:MAG TPA: hypothetical protein ENK57_16890 [Polyangiaceae bacterium]|nr:hypothetical protein [Polyangiaceae bacterium]